MPIPNPVIRVVIASTTKQSLCFQGDYYAPFTDKVISMKTLIIKSLLPSLYQRERNYPPWVKRGEGRFFNNVVLLITALVIIASLLIFYTYLDHPVFDLPNLIPYFCSAFEFEFLCSLFHLRLKLF